MNRSDHQHNDHQHNDHQHNDHQHNDHQNIDYQQKSKKEFENFYHDNQTSFRQNGKLINSGEAI